MTRRIAFVHASPAAIAPIRRFYAEAAPAAELTNLLDDGLLRLFAASRYDAVQERLMEMIDTAQRRYSAEAAIVTCSAVPPLIMRAISDASSIPAIKIDDAMAERAVIAGGRVGVLYSFAPTLTTTRDLVLYKAGQLGRNPAIVPHFAAAAYDALLADRISEHDSAVEAAAVELARSCDVLLLAQVSMAHLAERIEQRTAKPVLSSLASSFEVLRERLGGM